jgi:hypothetical protein
MFAGKPSMAISLGRRVYQRQARMDQNRNYGGRPPLSADALRSYRVVTFLTEKENEQLLKIAATQGKSVSLACRDLLVRVLCSNTAD